jgi:hypothetical protein
MIDRGKEVVTEDDEEDVASYCTALRKRENVVN